MEVAPVSTPAYCRLEDLPEVEPLIDAFVEQQVCSHWLTGVSTWLIMDWSMPW